MALLSRSGFRFLNAESSFRTHLLISQVEKALEGSVKILLMFCTQKVEKKLGKR